MDIVVCHVVCVQVKSPTETKKKTGYGNGHGKIIELEQLGKRSPRVILSAIEV